jgi:hypothetical protein
MKLTNPQNAVYMARQYLSVSGQDASYRRMLRTTGEVQPFSRPVSYDELTRVSGHRIISPDDVSVSLDAVPDDCTGYIIGHELGVYVLYYGKEQHETNI